MIEHLKELLRYRDLIWNLVVRDLKLRYKSSVLGVLWSWLNPLFMMTVYTIVFTVMRASSNGGIPERSFPAFVLCALLPWNFFSGSLTQAVGSIVENANLVKKVYFPREVLPLSTVLANLVNFVISLLVLFPILLIFHVRITPWVLLLPLLILIQLCLTVGIAFMLSTLNVFYRDTKVILDVVMMAWFFVTPVFYPIEVLPRSKEVLGIVVDVHRWTRILNPMASLVAAYRDVLYYGRLIGPDFLARTAVTSLVILFIGYALFYKCSKVFGEEV